MGYFEVVWGEGGAKSARQCINDRKAILIEKFCLRFLTIYIKQGPEEDSRAP
jgi:hypothetical protein